VPTAACNGIEICYETFGDPEDVPLLMVMGLGSQMIHWPDELCQGLQDRGFYVIRFDNRDVGLSTWFDDHPIDVVEAFTARFTGQAYDAPYLLSDMAADAVGLLDHLGVEAVHLVGASMGGMIVQTIAIEHPERVRSLTSIMSTTGALDVGAPDLEVAQSLLQQGAVIAADPDAAIVREVATRTLIASPDHLDEEQILVTATAVVERAWHPEGLRRQLVGIAFSPDRTEPLGAVQVPTLVVHGDADPLVGVSGGHATAAAIPGAELLVIEGMGHDLPPVFWSQIIEGITRTAASAASSTGAR